MKKSVYHISPWRFWLMPGMFLAFALLMFALVFEDSRPAQPETINIPVYIGLFFLAFAVAMYFLMRYTRLVLSDEGVKLYQFGYRLETDWSNVAYLDEGSGREGLVLLRPMNCPGASTLRSARHLAMKDVGFYNDKQIKLLGEQRFIPIDAFAYRLDRGNLRADVNRRAPAINNGLNPSI